MKRILLIGIGGVYNYGCEAIVRGTIKILRSKWPNCEIVYATPRLEDDRKRLADCELTLVHRGYNRYSAKNIVRKILSCVGIQWQPCLEDLSLLKNIDAVYSIGGDIFTLRSDGSYNASLAKFGEIAERKNIPYTLWCASVGPFTKNPEAEKFFKRHLSRISHIVAREHETINYLSNLGISSNVNFHPDPAFYVASKIETKVKSVRPVIGINLSPLSVKYAGIARNDAITDQVNSIVKLIINCNADVILLPHVICNFNENDDDLRYLLEIKNRMPVSISKNIQVIDSDPGFVGLKNTISQCDIVMSVRMHCAISAITLFVPTIFVTYSKKSIGMANLIYENSKWVVSVNDFNSENLYLLVQDMINNKKIVSDQIRNSVQRILSINKSVN